MLFCGVQIEEKAWRDETWSEAEQNISQWWVGFGRWLYGGSKTMSSEAALKGKENADFAGCAFSTDCCKWQFDMIVMETSISCFSQLTFQRRLIWTGEPFLPSELTRCSVALSAISCQYVDTVSQLLPWLVRHFFFSVVFHSSRHTSAAKRAWSQTIQHVWQIHT